MDEQATLKKSGVFSGKFPNPTGDEVRTLMSLAGFTVHNTWKLENRYWPEAYGYAPPGWLLKTDIGMVIISGRKRVVEVILEDVTLKEEITSDDVTKSECCVHAYDYAKLLEYLTNIRKLTR
jgi:hypothetical protein